MNIPSSAGAQLLKRLCDLSTKPGVRLTEKHLADLRGSGLNNEEIARCGFYTTVSVNAIRNLLNWKHYDGHLGPCLAIPFVDAAGRLTNYVRLKPDRPRKDAEGKPIKYESPQGVGNRVYFPPLTRIRMTFRSEPIIITEGEKKAARADQDGYTCLGLVGVYGWQKKREIKDGRPDGPRYLIDDMGCVWWMGRDVFICYDSDAVTNNNVIMAERRLGEALKQRGAKVRIVRLPVGPNGEKVGLDDFLVKFGASGFRQMLNTAAFT